MLRTYMLSKIHRATVTECNLNYEGSITIDDKLLMYAGIDINEKVDVLNITNGQRFSTYVIPGESGSGIIAINGAGARLAQVGDKVIIINYGICEQGKNPSSPRVIQVTESNEVIKYLNAAY